MTHLNASPSRNDDRQPSDAHIPLLEIEQGSVPTFPQPRHRPPQPVRRKPLPSSANAQSVPLSSVSPGEAISDTSQHLPLLDSQDNHDQGDIVTPSFAIQSKHSPGGPWLPYTLTWPYLIFLIILALGLSLLIALLMWRSIVCYGLGNDDGTSALFFGWRFSPTLVAVLYVLLTSMLLEDVKRTEPYARLSQKSGAEATYTLLQSPGAWWNALTDSLNKKKNNGRRSWILLGASLINIAGFLAISPLSSALLVSEDLLVPEQISFNRIAAFENAPLHIAVDDATYFRTISNLLQNLTTTAWLTNNYAILPFWPSRMDRIPLGASLSPLQQQWRGETTVFRADLDCVPMVLSGTGLSHNHDANDFDPWPFVTLESTDGCVYHLVLESSWQIVPLGGGSWSKVSNFSAPVWDNSPEFNMMELNITKQCQQREIIFVSTVWANVSGVGWLNTTRFEPTLQTLGQVCSPSYYMANVTVTASTTNTSTALSFDEALFNQSKVPITPSFIDVGSFQDLFLNPNWTTKLYPPNYGTRPSTGGPLVALAALYNFDTLAMIADKNLLANALRIKRRFFGEILQASFVSIGGQATTPIQGEMVNVRRRIVVNTGIAIALSSLLLISGIVLSLILISAPQKRTLNLFHDPATAMAAASLIANEPNTRSCVDGTDGMSRKELQDLLIGKKFHLDNGTLFVSESRTNKSSVTKQVSHGAHASRHDWRPTILRRWTGVGLIMLLLALIICIGILFAFSRGPGLYESAFVYQLNVSIFKSPVATLAPYSIVPTLVAVTVGLWWGSLEETFRRLQPFVTMTKEPTSISYGATLSYASSYLLWAAAKAISKRHWVLALVCMGAFFAQIFTVAMSALWQKAPSNMESHFTVARNLELRTVPALFDVMGPQSADEGDIVRTNVLSNLYTDFLTNWLYSATIQLSYSGNPPPWSSDGWSFVPLDLSQVPYARAVQDPGSRKSNAQSSTNTGLESYVNVTVTTPALRGRIECNPYETLNNLSNWLTLWDLTNATVWNVSANPQGLVWGYELSRQGMMLIPGNTTTQVVTTFFANPSQVVCCANETDGMPGTAALGYWSYNWQGDVQNEPLSTTSSIAYPTNFTVKWLVGKPVQQLYLTNTSWEDDEAGNGISSRLIWTDPPRLTALNCLPIIESANANVTVDSDTGVVHEFKILSDPVDCPDAWSDVYSSHNRTSGSLDGEYMQNDTTSYGVLFQDSLLSAAALDRLNGATVEGWGSENLDVKTFNFRTQGLNVDFMSYAMYSLVGGDAEALLDLAILQSCAQRVFSTFFQHFVSSNMTSNGSWAFQRIGERLPQDLDPIINQSSYSISSYQDANGTTVDGNTTTSALVSTRVELLQMSPAAVLLALCILTFLLLSAIFVYFVEYGHFKNLRGDVDTLASLLSLVYDSPNLLEWVSEHPNAKDWTQGPGNVVKAGLGSFKGASGQQRWGIEID